jgi:hypothetical protein
MSKLPQHDDLDDYLRGDSRLSRAYKQLPAPPFPRALDGKVLERARAARRKSQRLAPLALAASVLLSVAIVLAIIFGPRTVKHVNEPARILAAAARGGERAGGQRAAAREPMPPILGRTQQLYTSDPPRSPAGLPSVLMTSALQDPAAWLAQIAALRRAGRADEADVQYRRFLSAYPSYAVGDSISGDTDW